MMCGHFRLNICGCAAAIPSHSCPLWVNSRHRKASRPCPLNPQKCRYSQRTGRSLGQKAVHPERPEQHSLYNHLSVPPPAMCSGTKSYSSSACTAVPTVPFVPGLFNTLRKYPRLSVSLPNRIFFGPFQPKRRMDRFRRIVSAFVALPGVISR